MVQGAKEKRRKPKGTCVIQLLQTDYAPLNPGYGTRKSEDGELRIEDARLIDRSHAIFDLPSSILIHQPAAAARASGSVFSRRGLSLG